MRCRSATRPLSKDRSRAYGAEAFGLKHVRAATRLEQSVRDAGKATCPPGRKTGRARMESMRRLTPERSISVDPQPTEGPEAQTTCRRGDGAFTLFRPVLGGDDALDGLRLIHWPSKGSTAAGSCHRVGVVMHSAKNRLHLILAPGAGVPRRERQSPLSSVAAECEPRSATGCGAGWRGRGGWRGRRSCGSR